MATKKYTRNRLPKNLKNYTHINGELLDEALKKAGFNYASLGREVFSCGSMIRESIMREYIMTKYLAKIEELLEKPEGYFNYKEPVREEIKVISSEEKEPDTFKAELFVELKRIETLLLSINRKLDGKPTGIVINGKELGA